MSDKVTLTKEDFDIFDWQQLIDKCNIKQCSSYYQVFFDVSKEAEKANQPKERDLCLLLGKVASLHLDVDSKSEPFKPYLVLHNSRSPILDDLSDEEFELLKQIVTEIKDPEMRARVADVIWVGKRDFNQITIAVEAYIESFRRLFHPEHWSSGVERMERAIQLAILLGERNESYLNVVEEIEHTLNNLDGTDPLYLSARLMELLQEHRKGEPARYARLSQKMANKAEAENEWNKARTYWQTCGRWHSLNQDQESCRKVLIARAETYVREAEAAISNDKPSFMAASHFIQNAIEAYRRVGGQRERVDDLHRILLEYQKKSTDEMKLVSTDPIDVSDYVKQSIEEVKEKTLIDSLCSLATLTTSAKIKDLRIQAEKSSKDYLFKHIFSSVTVNDAGKVIGRQPSIISENEQEVEAALKVEMYQFANYHRHVQVQAAINPARQQIILEHNARVRDFFPIVYDNVFIPEGREEIYAHGLHAGLNGDFLTSTHLLIPQIENSIRHILTIEGFIVSTLDDQGIQEEKNLNSLLFLPELSNLIGEDLVFDLQGLLIERFGTNLRNRLAHGLVDHRNFFSLEAVYLWWITLRICYIYKVISIKNNQNEE